MWLFSDSHVSVHEKNGRKVIATPAPVNDMLLSSTNAAAVEFSTDIQFSLENERDICPTLQFTTSYLPK